MKLKPVLLVLFLTFLSASSVSAAGNFSVDWGGSPLFTVANMAPGQSVSRSVKVVSPLNYSQNILVSGRKSTETGHLSQVLLLTITENFHPIYGPKPLSDFFSTAAPGISLSPLKSKSLTTYTFTVTFPASAGNLYQGRNLVFDLQFSSTISTPKSCLQMPNPRLLQDCREDNFRYHSYLFQLSFRHRFDQFFHRFHR